MRLSFIFITLLTLQACTSPLPRNTPALAGAGMRPASEKAIYQAMGNGLIGEDFVTLSRPDQRLALEAEYRALEYGEINQPIGWQNTAGTTSGTVVAGNPYQVGSQNCRQYSHNFTLNGKMKTIFGSACRNEDGSWTPLL